MDKIEETKLLPFLWWLKPNVLLAIFGLHGGSLKAAEQQPVGKIPQVRWAQVTRLLLQEVTNNALWYICRGAIQRPGRHAKRPEKEEAPMTRQINNVQPSVLPLLLNVSVYLSYKAQFLLWGQYWQVCLLVRMSGSGDSRLFSPRLSTQLWMWWIKVFLSFSSSERGF